MLRHQASQRPITLYTMALAAVITVLGLAAAVTMQQMLRRGADQPQIDMTDRYADQIAAGEAPASVIPQAYVDLQRSLQPVVIFYDDHGRPGPGTGYLDQSLPSPPAGVLDYVREHGMEKVTWQPGPGVRLVSVIRRVSGRTPGFVLAGRSLRMVEAQESLLKWMAFSIWLIVMALLVGGTLLIKRAQPANPAVA